MEVGGIGSEKHWTATRASLGGYQFETKAPRESAPSLGGLHLHKRGADFEISDIGELTAHARLLPTFMKTAISI